MHEHSRDIVMLQACQRSVDIFRTRNQWQLLDREEFAHSVYDRLEADPTADRQRVALQVYTEALYRACSGAEGRQRQERGYTELFQYLCQRAGQHYPEVGADAAQRAIVAIHSAFDRCRRPETFLAFALQKLRDARRAELRLARVGDCSLDQSIGPAGETLGDHIAAAPGSDPAEQALRHELRQRLAQCAREFLRRHPRAAQQLAVLCLKYIDGLDDAAISRRLGKPLSSIYVLRSRGLAKLRDDPSWRALAADLA